MDALIDRWVVSQIPCISWCGSNEILKFEVLTCKVTKICNLANGNRATQIIKQMTNGLQYHFIDTNNKII